MTIHQCGPQFATRFFTAVHDAVIAANVHSRYLISCVDHETQILGVDFKQKAGITRVENGRLITEFVKRDSLATHGALQAYKWLGSTPICFLCDQSDLREDFGGPEIDPDFFYVITELREQLSNEASTYAIMSRALFAVGLGLRGDDDVLEGTIRDGRVYHILKKGDAIPAECVCCTWDDETGDCSGTWCPE